jgi:hypothetical protein
MPMQKNIIVEALGDMDAMCYPRKAQCAEIQLQHSRIGTQ